MCGSLKSACTWLIEEICRQVFFATAIWNEINLQTKCVQASFTSICVCYLVRCLIVVHLSWIESWQHPQISECAAWHQRSATPLCGATQSSVGQKGFNSTCWLESWVLSMTLHSAAWLIPTMVKIQELSQSYTSMTEEKWTTWRREWAVMAVNYVSSVTLIILTHIKKSPDRLHTSPTCMVGTASSEPKSRRASNL